MTFEDLTGNSGFTSDSEGASATLDINMSEDSARNLWDVQAAIQQISVDFQTAVRAAADFNSYLISIRETSQTIKMPSMGNMEGGSDGNMSYSGGRVDSGSVPLVQSEIGMASRIGEMEENASGAGGGAMAARATNTQPVDVGGFVNQGTQAAWLASSMGQRGQSQVTSDAYRSASRYAQGNPLDPQVMMASYNGQTGTPHAFAAQQLFSQGLPAAQQFLRGGGVGGFAAAAGRLGTFGAIGYAGYQLADAGLETYAQSRAMAISANNSQYGTGWGFGERIDQAKMAMSPFVSQKEAGDIYTYAIDQGWASRKGGLPQGDFGQAVNFMYGAAKDYNLNPDASSKLLQTNTLGAGQSIQALSEQLLTLKKTLDGTGVSMAAASSTFSSFSSFLIGAGASPGDAARIAGGTIKSFAENTYLGPNASGAETVMAAMQNPQVQAILGGMTGNLPGAVFSGDNANKSTSALEGIIHGLASQYAKSPGISEPNKVALFQTAYNQLTGQNIDPAKAKSLMYEAAANPNFMTKGQKDVDTASKMSLQHQNSAQSFFHGLDDFDRWAGSQTGGVRSVESIEKDSASINAHNFYSPEVNKLLDNSGDNLSSMVLYGPDGKPVQVGGNRVAGANIAKWFDDQKNYDTFQDSKNGYYIKNESDNNQFNSANIGSGGSNAGATAAGGNANNTVYITLSTDAKAWFATNVDKLPMSDGKTHQ